MPIDPALARDVIALFEKHAAPAPPNSPFYHSVAAVGMGRYHGLLAEAGFETLREVKEVEVADLVSLGVPGFHAAEMLAVI